MPHSEGGHGCCWRSDRPALESVCEGLDLFPGTVMALKCVCVGVCVASFDVFVGRIIPTILWGIYWRGSQVNVEEFGRQL